MATINGKALVKDGKPLDRVYSNGQLMYGRNLLEGTQKFAGSQWSQIPSVSEGNNENAIIQVSKNGVVFYYDKSKLVSENKINTNDDYTLSFIVKNGSSSDINVVFLGGATNQNNNVISKVNKNSGLITLVKLFNFWTLTGSNVIGISVSGLDTAGIVEFSLVKAERNSLSTPWTPAPEDYI